MTKDEKRIKDLQMALKNYKRTDCVPVSGSLLYDLVTMLEEKDKKIKELSNEQ